MVKTKKKAVKKKVKKAAGRAAKKNTAKEKTSKKKLTKKKAVKKKVAKKKVKKAAGKAAKKSTTKKRNVKKKLTKKKAAKKKVVKKKITKKKISKVKAPEKKIEKAAGKSIKKSAAGKKPAKKKIVKKNAVHKKIAAGKAVIEKPAEKREEKKKAEAIKLTGVAAREVKISKEKAPEKKRVQDKISSRKAEPVEAPVKKEKVKKERAPETFETPQDELKEITEAEPLSPSPQEKYVFTPEAHRSKVTAHDPYATPVEPPGVYLKDRIILMVIDPGFVYVYWEVKPETLEAGKNFIGHDSGLVLRVYDATSLESFNGYNAHHHWDIPVHDRVGGWYLRLGHPDKTLVVDVGLKNSRGDFYNLVRSNFASVPRNTVAHTEKIYWMTVNDEGEAVITEVEEFTDEDLELLKKMLGEEMYKRLMKGKLTEFLGSSMVRDLFLEINPAPGGASDFAKLSGVSSDDEELQRISQLPEEEGK